MSFQWDIRPSEAWVAMADAYLQQIHSAVLAISYRYAAEIEAYMKQNALWTDRTGNARQSLHTAVRDISMNMVEIILAHGVDYGINLELNYGGRYAIIGPTIDIFAPHIWADIVSLFR